MNDSPVVRIEASGGVGHITLNRPERRNALHHDMFPPIKDALSTWSKDDSIGCIVLTGAGEGFCSGGDVRDGRRGRRGGASPSVHQAVSALGDDAEVALMLHESPKIVLAAVNGAAVGAGMSLALACDLRIMAASARLIPGWRRLAFSGDFGGTWFLTRMLGSSRALEVLIGDIEISSDEALAWGLANKVVPDNSFADAWREWAAELAQGPAEAHALMKANVRDAMAIPLDSFLPKETERQVLSSRTADHKEAVRAWLEAMPGQTVQDR
ncbi:MAG: enoyl-CoA hydratase-related protein [bacterium]|nr:enoyl-CoA hydratase-related protein [bacterium]